MSLPPELDARLHGAGLDPAYVEELARAALDEDLDSGIDVTSEATVPADQRARAELVARADGVVAGLPVAEAVLTCAAAAALEVDRPVAAGERLARGPLPVSVTGPNRALLLGERTALNLVCHLSGVATATRRWADVLEGTGAVVRDPR